MTASVPSGTYHLLLTHLLLRSMGMFYNRQRQQRRLQAEHGSSLTKRAAKEISANSLIAKVKAAFARLALVPAVA